MARLSKILSITCLLLTNAALKAQTAHVVVCELEIRYGSYDFEASKSDGFEYVNDGLACRISSELLEANESVSFELDDLELKLKLRPHRSRRPDLQYTIADNNHNQFYSNSGSYQRKEGFAAHNSLIWTYPRARGGHEITFLVAYRVEEDGDAAPMVTDLSPLGYLRSAYKNFQSQHDRGGAETVLALGRLLGPQKLGLDSADCAELAGKLEAAMSPDAHDDSNSRARRRRNRRRRRGLTSWDSKPHLLNQFRLAAGIEEFVSEEAEHVRTRFRVNQPGVISGYRYLAENESLPAAARIVALTRAVNSDRRIDSHATWIAMLESSSFDPVDGRRDKLIFKLNAERQGREIPDLALLALGTLGALLATLYALRKLTRRAITS